MTSFVDKPRFSNAQNAARVFIYNSKHISMVSLSYFENQILTLESLPTTLNKFCVKVFLSLSPIIITL